LRNYPETPLKKEQLFKLAQAYETWWSLGKAAKDDPTAQGAQIEKSEDGLQRAIALYQQLIDMDPKSPQARAAKLRLPYLRLCLDTAQRAFFCFEC
jgi:outer membrane protein assembly factor BamD (BamD/ComL family)